ncbi:hypothetical protein COO60DRAFT_184861 [Scenedesmus sp. NREL 46B-D3]|nr:hypothetical protein COO60DRAFT_184861 [Scenedesmus sp. NREL 46B-D3]
MVGCPVEHCTVSSFPPVLADGGVTNLGTGFPHEPFYTVRQALQDVYLLLMCCCSGGLSVAAAAAAAGPAAGAADGRVDHARSGPGAPGRRPAPAGCRAAVLRARPWRDWRCRCRLGGSAAAQSGAARVPRPCDCCGHSTPGAAAWPDPPHHTGAATSPADAAASLLAKCTAAGKANVGCMASPCFTSVWVVRSPSRLQPARVSAADDRPAPPLSCCVSA